MAFVGRGINTVRTVGDQTITGNKTFTGDLSFIGGTSKTTLTQQDDNNFVIYKDGTAIAASDTREPILVAPANNAIGNSNPNAVITMLNQAGGGSGYMKLGNGLTLQYGYSALTKNSTTRVTLPTPFKNDYNWAMATAYWSPSSGRQDPLVIKDYKSTYFDIQNAATDSGNIGVFYIAMGE